MTTFVLKHYEDQPPDAEKAQSQEEQGEDDKDFAVEIKGSVAEIVAAALYKTLGNHVKEVDETSGQIVEVNAVSTEDINADPLQTFRSIGQDDIVFIQSQGFHTNEEEWFLMNLPNKTDKVFYTVEALTSYLVSQLKSHHAR